MLNWLKRLVRHHQLKQLRKRGLQIADDCLIMGLPNFGSEPYLISIGKRVAIASNVTFINHDGATYIFRRHPEFEGVIRYGRITIHDDCIIGYGAILLPGVSIGPNAVVAAGAIVAKDVPPNSVAGGNPAKVLVSADAYMQKCIAENPKYDRENYRKNKIAELLKLYPRPW